MSLTEMVECGLEIRDTETGRRIEIIVRLERGALQPGEEMKLHGLLLGFAADLRGVTNGGPASKERPALRLIKGDAG